MSVRGSPNPRIEGFTIVIALKTTQYVAVSSLRAGQGDLDPSEIRVALARAGSLEADSTAFVEFRHALSAYGLEVEDAGVERLSPRFSRCVSEQPARWVVVVCGDATSRTDIAESLQRELRDKGIRQHQVITIAVGEGRGLQLARSVQVRVEALQRRLDREGTAARQRSRTPLALVPPDAPRPATSPPPTPPPITQTPAPAPAPAPSSQARRGDALEPAGAVPNDDIEPVEPLAGSQRLPMFIAAALLGLAALVGGSFALRGCGSAEAGAPEQEADGEPTTPETPKPVQPIPTPPAPPDTPTTEDALPVPPAPPDDSPDHPPAELGAEPVLEDEVAIEDLEGPDLEQVAEVTPEQDARLIAAGLHKQAFRALDILLIDTDRSKRTNFAGAKEHCENRELEGVGGWRLPTVGEASSLTAAGMVKKDRYWTATRGDTFGKKQVVWDSRRKRIRSFSIRFRGARAICVRLQSEPDLETGINDEPGPG